MKYFNKSSIAGFAIGFIFFPIIVFTGGYVYFNFVSDGFSDFGSTSLNPPDLPSERIVSLDWRVKTLDGVEVNLKDYTQDKTVFLNFWATWCPPCVEEMPSIDRLYSRFGDSMAFVCISNENAEVLKGFFKGKGYSFPVFYADTSLQLELNATALPTTFIISSEGKILLKHVGGADWAHESVVAYLTEEVAQG